MTQPLALVLYEKLLPGSQLVNRLQDLNYRVQTLADAAKLVQSAEETKPILVLADLTSSRQDVAAAIAHLRQHAATKHLPVIAFEGGRVAKRSSGTVQPPGVTLLVSESAILNHLSECLQQALQLE
jgi:CheY-like chemotaxis protein